MENPSRFASLIGPPSLYLFLMFLLPIGLMLVYSFRAGISGAAHDTFTLKHYSDFLANTNFHRLLWRSALISLVSPTRQATFTATTIPAMNRPPLRSNLPGP